MGGEVFACLTVCCRTLFILKSNFKLNFLSVDIDTLFSAKVHFVCTKSDVYVGWFTGCHPKPVLLEQTQSENFEGAIKYIMNMENKINSDQSYLCPFSHITDICLLLRADPGPELPSSDLTAHFSFTAVNIPKRSLASPEPLITIRVIQWVLLVIMLQVKLDDK